MVFVICVKRARVVEKTDRACVWTLDPTLDPTSVVST